MKLIRDNHAKRSLACSAVVLSIILTAGCSLLRPSVTKTDSLALCRTLAGFNREFGEPFGVAVRGDEIFISDGERGTVSRILPDESVQVYVSGLSTPSSIAFAQNGDIIVAETGSNTIKRIAANGSISLVAGGAGKRGFADGEALQALFNGPIGIAVDLNDRIYVSDTYNDRIRVIENGSVHTLAGGSRGFADGPASDSRFDTPLGIALWHDKLLVADAGNGRVRVVENDGSAWTLSGSGSGELEDGTLPDAKFVFPTAIATFNGAIYVADGNSIRAIGRRIFPLVETLSDRRPGLSDGPTRGSRFNRPSGIGFTSDGKLIIADSDNQLVRTFTETPLGSEITREQKRALRYSAEEFRSAQPARWPFDPPQSKREIAGTLGEVRGQIAQNKSAWFHNGLDIAGAYGETSRFVRTETVLEPQSIENVGTARELIRMPTMGYIHIRLGRDQNDRFFQESPFVAELDAATGKPENLRVPRGTHFEAGEPIGTLNALNHVHLITGRSGAEMNALDALILPGVSDAVIPTIEDVSLLDENWEPVETGAQNSRIRVAGKARIIVRAYDRVDGNSQRRRLGVYRLKYLLLDNNGNVIFDPDWTINFDRMPESDAVPFVYAPGSRSGYTPDTVFNYIVTNRVEGENYNESFLDTSQLPPGNYAVRVIAADFFGNSASKDIRIEVNR